MTALASLTGELPQAEHERDDVDEAYGPGSLGAEHLKRALFKPRQLCWELGVLTEGWAGLWKRFGIYAANGPPV